MSNVIVLPVAGTEQTIVNATVCRDGDHYLTYVVELSDGNFTDLWRWFSDEGEHLPLAATLIGMTPSAATDMLHERDVAHIRSWV